MDMDMHFFSWKWLLQQVLLQTEVLTNHPQLIKTPFQEKDSWGGIGRVRETASRKVTEAFTL